MDGNAGQLRDTVVVWSASTFLAATLDLPTVGRKPTPTRVATSRPLFVARYGRQSAYDTLIAPMHSVLCCPLCPMKPEAPSLSRRTSDATAFFSHKFGGAAAFFSHKIGGAAAFFSRRIGDAAAFFSRRIGGAAAFLVGLHVANTTTHKDLGDCAL